MEIGHVGKSKMHEETFIEWAIPEFSSITENMNADYFVSPKFSFCNDSWTMTFKPLSEPGCFLLNLGSSGPREYSVSYAFSMEYMNYDVEPIVNGIIPSQCLNSFSILLDVAETVDMAPPSCPDVFVIMCILKRIDSSTQPNEKNKSKGYQLIKLDTLSENFTNLFANKESCDTILNVKDREYKAHRAVLTARSSVFAAMFLHDTSEKQTGIVNIPDCDPELFQTFLEFLYSGKLDTAKLTARSALHLYQISDKYDVQELKAFSADYLELKMTIELMFDVAVIADMYDDTDLLAVTQSFFNKNISKILTTPEWEHLLENNYRLANKLLIAKFEKREKKKKKGKKEKSSK